MMKLGLKCNKCGDVIWSTHRHDFKWCKCHECFVDGGDDYFRYGGGNDYKVVECIFDKSGKLIKTRNRKGE